MLTQRQLVEENKRLVTMPFMKIGKFHNEFPWIRKHIGFNGQQVYVSVVSSELIDYRLANEEEFRQPSFMGPEFSHEKMYLLGENGVMVTSRESITIPMRRYVFFGRAVNRHLSFKIRGRADEIVPLESVLRKLGNAITLVRYVLSYFPYTSAVIVYKVPKDLDLRQLIKDRLPAETAISGLEEFRNA